MPGCLFCNIVAGTTPAQIVHDNEHVVAFKDIRPIAPVHVLVIPKEHIPGIHDATPAQALDCGNLFPGLRGQPGKGCERFGMNGELPYGGYPAASLIKS